MTGKRFLYLVLAASSSISCGADPVDEGETTTTTTSSIRLIPDSERLAPGMTQRLFARLTLSDGRTDIDSTNVQWRSSDPRIAMVNSRGIVQAVAAGNATIEARHGGAVAAATITVAVSNTALAFSARETSRAQELPAPAIRTLAGQVGVTMYYEVGTCGVPLSADAIREGQTITLTVYNSFGILPCQTITVPVEYDASLSGLAPGSYLFRIVHRNDSRRRSLNSVVFDGQIQIS